MRDAAYEEFLILTKTYPSPSSKYRETTCVAAINRHGELRRLYPVPFRLLDGHQQFRKWEWIRARAMTPRDDHRPESRRIEIDSIVKLNERVGTENRWAKRLHLIDSHIVSDFAALESRRQETGQTLGFVRPSSILGLEISTVKQADWTANDLAKLLQEGLFDSNDVQQRPPLEKLGHNFHYHYASQALDGSRQEYCHKIVDWEAGQLYRRCKLEYNDGWEMAFRQKYEREFAAKDLILMLGTIHRFPDQWLIIGVLYPPRRTNLNQLPLDFGVPGE